MEECVNVGSYDADWDSVEHALKAIDADFSYSPDTKVYYPYWAVKARRAKKFLGRELQHEINMLVDAQHGNLSSVDVFPENQPGPLPDKAMSPSLSEAQACALVKQRMPRRKFSMVFSVDILSTSLLYLPLWVIDCEHKEPSQRNNSEDLKILFDPGTGKYVSFKN